MKSGFLEMKMNGFFFPRSRQTRYISASHATEYIPDLGLALFLNPKNTWTYKTHHLSHLSPLKSLEVISITHHDNHEDIRMFS